MCGGSLRARGTLLLKLLIVASLRDAYSGFTPLSHHTFSFAASKSCMSKPQKNVCLHMCIKHLMKYELTKNGG